MAVRWIGDAAHDLGLSPIDAVELLARHQNYPMNGFLDEDRVLLLKRYARERAGVESTGRAAAAAAAAAAAVAAGNMNATQQTAKVPQIRNQTDATAVTAVTSPLDSQPDHAEDRTVIIPPPLPNA
jgi:hypothetical protein